MNSAQSDDFLAPNMLIWRLFQRLIQEFNLAVDSFERVSYYAPRSQHKVIVERGYSSAGRALAWHARGRR
ncbi:hypothetical protein, partial [Serratia marcescens]|uniref:hypothetical protein n=4 Tax=Serratia marcescens TaxID=615 RepID=UPI0019558F6A